MPLGTKVVKTSVALRLEQWERADYGATFELKISTDPSHTSYGAVEKLGGSFFARGLCHLGRGRPGPSRFVCARSKSGRHVKHQLSGASNHSECSCRVRRHSLKAAAPREACRSSSSGGKNWADPFCTGPVPFGPRPARPESFCIVLGVSAEVK